MLNIKYDYLSSLNKQQREAVEYNEGPELVIAGAGSGKTRVLTYKLVHLIRQGYEPYRILALTFTNKAAREMKDRIKDAVGEKIASKIKMGTFHSVFLSILRRHGNELGFKNGFSIYDTADSKSLIKTIVKDMGLDEKIYKPSILLSTISNAKNAMISPDQYIADDDNIRRDTIIKRPLTGNIYAEYCRRSHLANAMDFDDIIYFTNLLLRDHPDICRHYQEFFRYILVDEYQDTNLAQHITISLLSGNHNNICVVGDDAQSIYSFRGAEIGNILGMNKSFPSLKIFKLEQNYRSTKNIVNAAGSLIEKNTRQINKNLFSNNSEGEKISVFQTYSDIEEAFIISNLISQSKLTNHDSFDDYAVLYRTNAQSRVLEESLRKRNIPYVIYGGLSFYQRKEVKDVIAYFRLTVNQDDNEALRRIVNYPPRGIGEVTMKKLSIYANENGMSIWQALESGNLKEAGLSSASVSKLVGFHDLIKEFITDNKAGANAFELAQLIYNRTGILLHLAHDTTPESISRQENLSEILNGLRDFVDLREQMGESDISMNAFLSEVMLSTDQDENINDNEPKVKLMTVHAAKGLEFSHIYVVGVEEELFPSLLSSDSLKGVEEERRLLYVAITRAKKTCTITYATSRFRNGQQMFTSPSRFLREINPEYLNIQCSGNFNNNFDCKNNFIDTSKKSNNGFIRKPVSNNRNKTYQQNNQYVKIDSIGESFSTGFLTHSLLSIGDKIMHSKFGEGVILDKIKLSGEEAISVDFGVLGIKKLLLKFAKFTILK